MLDDRSLKRARLSDYIGIDLPRDDDGGYWTQLQTMSAMTCAND